ncbi:retrovirus-related pol polyprotein from transposon TNT 1-94 [Tanacetum coccineum]
MSNSSSMSSGFQPKFTPKLIQYSQQVHSSQNELKIQKDYKTEYKKVKAKLALLEARRTKEVFDDVEMTQVKVLMALADDELPIGKNHARNGEWIDITMRKLSLLNFKNISKLVKQNKVLGLPLLVYSKDKPCLACEKGKHHRSYFKTKQNFSIRKYLHLLHMDLFGPVSPMSINHEKYTLVIVDEYSRYTWAHFLRKKSQTTDVIMSFIIMVENQNDVKVKQIRTDNGIDFRNSKLESFYDEKGISQNFSSPYTPKQNGVA